MSVMTHESHLSRRADFCGVRIVVFESRMAEAMTRSIASHGGIPIHAPALKEIPLSEHQAVVEFGDRLLAGRVDVLLCLTGVGTRLLLETLAMRVPLAQVVAALERVTVVARGPKPVAVLRAQKIPITISVPEPNTWQELLHALDLDSRGLSLEGRTVAIQEYGVSNARLIEALQSRGATVLQVPVYRWGLPDDVEPLRDAIRHLIEGKAQVALFTNAAQVAHTLRIASDLGLTQPFRDALERRVVVASIGPMTSEALRQENLPVDFEPSHPKMGLLISELAARSETLIRQKTAPASSTRVAAQPASVVPPASGFPPVTGAVRRESLFLKACRREPTGMTPAWIMRQAGRYLPAYRALRNKVSFLQLCKTPELAAEVTMMAVEAIRPDAAILFSDILLLVEPLGLSLEYGSEEGPVISGDVATKEDVKRLPEVEPEESLQFVFEAARLSRAALPSTIPLIGFAGAPFTLASYMIEGGTSKSFLQTKRLMYADAGAWHALLEKISRGLVKYLNGQIAAGAEAVQLFDSWVGCMSPSDYRTFVLPHTQAVIKALTPGVPVIHFGTGTAAFLREMRIAGGDVIGVDFRVELDEAWRAVGEDVGIQGNLDPAILLAPIPVIRDRIARILEQADGRPGHIFNLGHGVLPSTPPDHVVACIEAVHELSAAKHRP